MPDADGAATDTNENDQDGESANAIPPTLDQIHSVEQARVEQEDADADTDGDDNTDENKEDAEADSSDGAKTDTDGSDNGASVGDDDANDDNDDNGAKSKSTDGATDTRADDKTTTPSEPTTPLVNPDITQNAEGKVAIEDAEGKTFYFNNLDELPNDFEPATYKGWMVATKALLRKEDTDLANKTKADEAAAQGVQRERAEALEKSWDIDAADLTSAGLFPKDETKNLAAREEVLNYMEAEMKKGNTISSFKQAFKAMSFDKEQAAKAEAQKQEDGAKKKRGGVVQPGSGGSTAPPATNRGGKVIQGPPSGATLDQVHTHVTSDL